MSSSIALGYTKFVIGRSWISSSSFHRIRFLVVLEFSQCLMKRISCQVQFLLLHQHQPPTYKLEESFFAGMEMWNGDVGKMSGRTTMKVDDRRRNPPYNSRIAAAASPGCRSPAAYPFPLLWLNINIIDKFIYTCNIHVVYSLLTSGMGLRTPHQI